jgi:hypothetical protein
MNIFLYIIGQSFKKLTYREARMTSILVQRVLLQAVLAVEYSYRQQQRREACLVSLFTLHSTHTTQRAAAAAADTRKG